MHSFDEFLYITHTHVTNTHIKKADIISSQDASFMSPLQSLPYSPGGNHFPDF